MDDDPILSNREKGTIIKAVLGLAALVMAAPYVAGAVAIGFLLLVAAIGIVAGLADWFLHYGLPTLGVFVVCVLALRSLFGRPPRRLRHLADDVETRALARDDVLDAELEILRHEIAVEKAGPTRRLRSRSTRGA